MVIRQSTTSTKYDRIAIGFHEIFLRIRNSYILAMCAAARTPSPSPTLFLLFLSMLFFYVLQKDAACGEPGTGIGIGERGCSSLLYMCTRTPLTGLCALIGSDSATVRTYSPRRTSYSSEQSQTTRQEHRPQWSLCGMCRAGSLAAPVRRLCGPYAISPWLPTPTTNLS